MSLKEYKAKRDFKKTNEPATAKKSESPSLNFCVQKHAARSLHYDFRLECRGVLISWAVPKGPSLNPQDKRLAIKVEDHPLDYQYFEGIIPKGNYGAGTVEIWDSGTYTMPHASTRKEIEKDLLEGLKKGHFAVILHGEKLQGEFVFQKLKKDPDDNSWLLIKKEDAFEDTADITKSAKKKVKSKIPDFIPPMLATLVDKSFDSEDWLFEVKWDGFRAQASVSKGKVKLQSRNKLSFNQKFPSIVDELEKIQGEVIFDGEIVVVDSKGKSQFQLIQNYKDPIKETNLCYYVFDILYKDGEDLRDLPLIKRKEILKKYLDQLSLPSIRYSDHIIRDGKAFFKAAVKEHLEGVIGKKISSVYQSKRSPDWVKIKTSLRQEVIICGFTEPKGSRKQFGALIAGVYDSKNKLKYAGHVGGGFDGTLLDEIYKRLQPLIIKKCPFEAVPKVNTPVTWVRPKLIAEVSFAEWTKDSIMRQPIFQGLRDDKRPAAVKKEIPRATPVTSNSKGSIKNIKDLTLTHLEKVYWPEEKITKGDLIAYYEKVAPFILPYLKNRPIMLHRYPDGIKGKDFYHKDINFTHPEWLKTFPVKHEGTIANYMLIDDKRSLLYAVNLGSIDLHPFLSNISNLENPDYCIIDLDPHDVPFGKLIEAALTVHDVLEKAKVKHFCKTSGGKGLHIMIPLHAKYDYVQSRQFAEIVCGIVNKKLSKTTSMERSPEKRPKKIYLDCLQNRFGQSIVAPYAVRPRPKAMVSTPLLWEEVNNELAIADYNIETVPARLNKIGDILKPVLGAGINIQAALKVLSKDL